MNQNLNKAIYRLIPKGSILGLNYSGHHDSSIAIVSPSGEALFACSLERVSRVKQDSRPPYVLLQDLPWDRIERVAVSTNQTLIKASQRESRLHPVLLQHPRLELPKHTKAFKACLDEIPIKKEFVDHQLSHASSAYWLSGFEEAVCLTYDGGMHNSPWFGGLYYAERSGGIKPLDLFHAAYYAKITTLYSIITGLLGFTPNKHEGKVTGLAAFGSPSKKCRKVLEKLFTEDYFTLEETAEWLFPYSQQASAVLAINEGKREALLKNFTGISQEEIAATLQEMTELHIRDILQRAQDIGWLADCICLAGGLFANVRLNKAIKEFGFKQVFIAPPMTDDGTTLGAALQVASQNPQFNPNKLKHVFFGYSFGEKDINNAIEKYGLKYTKVDRVPEFLAQKLAEGKVIGVFQGAMEYGPRALGNRSIISEATRIEINQELNSKLNRTEFMPFAPMTRLVDIETCYKNTSGAEHTAEFMTITFDCTDEMKKQSPAVVHVDGTARPQIIVREKHPFFHTLLTAYYQLTGLNSIINTSFNIHEEPIICSPEDAIEGFLEAGLDLLCFVDTGYIVAFEDNLGAALKLLQSKRVKPSQKQTVLSTVNRELWIRYNKLLKDNQTKEDVINGLVKVCEERKQVIDVINVQLAELGEKKESGQRENS